MLESQADSLGLVTKSQRYINSRSYESFYRNLCAKGFLSETSILGTNFWPKKWQKAHISAGSRNLKKLKKCDPL